MTTIRRLTTATLVALSIVAAYLIAATTASARPFPPDDAPLGNVPVAPASTPTSTIVSNGSPWWTFVLVAAAAIGFTILVALLVSRMRHTRSAHALAH